MEVLLYNAIRNPFEIFFRNVWIPNYKYIVQLQDFQDIQVHNAAVFILVYAHAAFE